MLIYEQIGKAKEEYKKQLDLQCDKFHDITSRYYTEKSKFEDMQARYKCIESIHNCLEWTTKEHTCEAHKYNEFIDYYYFYRLNVDKDNSIMVTIKRKTHNKRLKYNISIYISNLNYYNSWCSECYYFLESCKEIQSKYLDESTLKYNKDLYELIKYTKSFKDLEESKQKAKEIIKELNNYVRDTKLYNEYIEIFGAEYDNLDEICKGV